MQNRRRTVFDERRHAQTAQARTTRDRIRSNTTQCRVRGTRRRQRRRLKQEPPTAPPASLTKERKMETVFIDRAGQPIPEQRRLIRSIEHLKRVLRKPGITLERLDFNGYRASPPRTIQAVHSRYIVFEDGAHLTFPRRDEFDSREDFILWGRLAYRIGIADEFQQP